MYFIFLLFILMVIPSLINTLNYYMPGMGTIIYLGLFVYFFYLSSTKRKAMNTHYKTNTTSNRTYTNNQSTWQTNSTSAKAKEDVIDVEFSEQEVK